MPLGMAGPLFPGRPAVHEVAATLELGDGGRGKAGLHVQEIARVAEGEATGEPAWPLTASCTSRP